MNGLHIALLLLAAVVVWLAWILSPPRRCSMLSDADRRRLDALVPPDTAGGNIVETYTGFDAVFDRLLADIDGARSHVHMQFLKFEDDATSHLVGDALAACVARGGEARLLYDDVMCYGWRRYYRRLRSRGVATAGFRPVHWPVPHRVDYYRNHRKCIIVDGRVAYIGGVNVADRYRLGLPWGCWRDTVVRIEGPAAAAVQRVFAADWIYTTGRFDAAASWFPRLSCVGSLPVRIVPSGPIGDGHAIFDLTVRLLEHAERYVWFESPYFIPPAAMRRALHDAAARGVDVCVLLPPRGDRGEGTQWASKSYFDEMLEAGVRIAMYQKGYMHSKIIVADDRTAVVGSCNIDPRSYFLCQEVAAVVDDRDYALSLKSVFLADEACSRHIALDEWRRRPLGNKIHEALFRTVASQL